MNPRGQRRLERWEKSGRIPQSPMTRCTEAALPKASYMGADLSEYDTKRLKAIDPSFCVKYDIAITNGFGPGHILYREVEKQDGLWVLQMEFPLQWELDMQWPKGVPRAPGPWLPEAVKARMRQGTVDEQIREMTEQIDKVQDRKDKELTEASTHLAKELAPWMKACANKERRGGINPGRHRGRKSPKVTIVVPSGIEAVKYGK